MISGADIDLLHREAQTECIRLSIEKNEPLLVTNQHFEVIFSFALSFQSNWANTFRKHSPKLSLQSPSKKSKDIKSSICH